MRYWIHLLWNDLMKHKEFDSTYSIIIFGKCDFLDEITLHQKYIKFHFEFHFALPLAKQHCNATRLEALRTNSNIYAKESGVFWTILVVSYQKLVWSTAGAAIHDAAFGKPTTSLISRKSFKFISSQMSKMSTRVYVGGLSHRSREKDVERFFRKFGRIREISMKVSLLY